MIESFLSFDPFLIHAVVLTVALAAGLIVALGIVKESPHFSIANIMVVGGVVVESICTLLLFMFDERISSGQQSTIATQQTQLLALNVRAGIALNSATIANNRVVNLLKENMALERALAPRSFSATFTVDLAPFPRIPLYFSSVDKEEPKSIMRKLMWSFNAVKVGNFPPWALNTFPVQQANEGITVEYVSTLERRGEDASNQSRLAVAICESLKNQGLFVKVEDFPSDFVGFKQEWPSAVPTDAVAILVGEKPTNFWENKKLVEDGFREMPTTGLCTANDWEAWIRERNNRPPRKP